MYAESSESNSVSQRGIGSAVPCGVIVTKPFSSPNAPRFDIIRWTWAPSE